MDGNGDKVDGVRADAHVCTLGDVDIDALWQRGLRGMILDLDNTCAPYQQHALAPGVADWVARARARGFRIVLLSNNFPARVAAVAACLGIRGVPNALKPLPLGFLRALRMLGTPRSQTVVIGDQLLTDVLGGKILGLYAVLTDPLVIRDFPLTRVLRFLERRLLGRFPS